MKLFENEMTLPGVYTNAVINTRTGWDTSQWGTTEPVVIVGTAFNGKVGVPLQVFTPEHGIYTFGEAYDPKTRREATLIPAIKDAWDRGCRTIYAVRISGKDTFKDYNLSIDSNLRLRVSGIFPSNSNKDVSALFNITEQDLYVKIFKPAAKATMSEKRQGLVESKESILENHIDLSSMELSLESPLSDFINVVNKNAYNNVLKFSIINEREEEVLSSAETSHLKIKHLFSGLYTIGRDKTFGIPNTIVQINAKDLEVEKYLKLNSNVQAPYPIYAETKAELSAYLKRPMVTMFDFLSVPGAIDEVFGKDNVDYEEVDLTDFEIYKRLGSGYAINAQVIESNGRYKVKEVDESDKEKRRTEITDGIYSSIEGEKIKYRVVAGVYADTKIKNRLPRKEEFQKAVSQEMFALEDVLEIKSVVNELDFSEEKSYSIEFISQPAEINSPEDIEAALCPNIAKVVSTLNEDDLNKKVNYKEGSLFLGNNEGSKQLFVVSNKRLVPLHEDAKDALDGSLVIADGLLYECKDNSFVPAVKDSLDLVKSNGENYIAAMLENETFVIGKITNSDGSDLPDDSTEDSDISISDGEETIAKPKKKTRNKKTSGTVAVEILGTVSQLFNEEEKVITALTSYYGENKIKIYSPDFDVLTVEEVVEMLNEDKDFSKLFKVSINKYSEAQEIMEYVIDGAGDSRIVKFEKDKEIIMDVNKLIPFRTDDNFARHLAQHCAYTTLKTAPTHGIIGCKPSLDVSQNAVSKRIKELLEMKLESTLIAKRANGSNMLDGENNTHPIGRYISIPFGQYVLNLGNGYSTISNLAAGYAGMISALSLDTSSTCQSINIPTPMFELNSYQLTNLTKGNFVTVKNSYTKGIVITDGITMASEADLEYRRLSAIRVADACQELIRIVAEPYIGAMNNIANENSLRAAIKSELGKLVGVLIESFDFNFTMGSTGDQIGVINIDTSITAFNEIRAILGNIKIEQ